MRTFTATCLRIPFNFSWSATSLLMYVFVLASSDKIFTAILTLLLLTATGAVLNAINSSIRPKSWFVIVVWDLSSFCFISLHFLDSCCYALFSDCSSSAFFDDKLLFSVGLFGPLLIVPRDFFSSSLFCTEICFLWKILSLCYQYLSRYW